MSRKDTPASTSPISVRREATDETIWVELRTAIVDPFTASFYSGFGLALKEIEIACLERAISGGMGFGVDCAP